MKKRNVAMLSFLLVAVMLLSVGCAAAEDWDSMWNSAVKMGEKLNDPQVQQLTEEMIDAIRENDPEAAKAVITAEVDPAAVEQVVSQLYPAFADMDVYTLQAANIQKNKNLGTDVTNTAIRYLLAGGKNTPGELRFYVDVTHSSQEPQCLKGFHVTDYQEIIYSGTLTTMADANGAQWAMLLIGALELAFVIWMFVDCCMHKMEKKWLWLLLTGLAMFSFQVISGSGQFHVRYNVGWIMSYSMLRLSSQGEVFFQLLIPIGAIVYAILRKKLFADYEKRNTPVVMPEAAVGAAVYPECEPEAVEAAVYPECEPEAGLPGQLEGPQQEDLPQSDENV